MISVIDPNINVDIVDLLLKSSQKLSYLEINREKLGILESEINQVLKVKALQKEYISSIRNLETHAAMEQITQYSGIFSYYFFYKAKSYLSDNKIRSYFNGENKSRAFRSCWRRLVRNPWNNMFRESRQESKKLSKVCVVPLPHFNSYSNFPEDRPKKDKEHDDNFVIPYKGESAFTRVASDQHDNSIFRQGDTVLEVLLQYKWRKFARWRFWCVICAIHVIYYISYSTGVLFSHELYGFVPGKSSLLDDRRHLVSIIFMCVSGSVLILQEFHQFFYTYRFLSYFRSGYNWVDILAFIFPLITLLQSLLGWDHLVGY
jgi:hypothetical protein